MATSNRTIAVIGGTGAEGGGLALRWAHAGHRVIIGSRDIVKARTAAAELNALLADATVECADVKSAARAAEIVVLTVPFAAQRSTVEILRDDLRGKLLIDVTVPLVPPKVSLVQLPTTDSVRLSGSGVAGPRGACRLCLSERVCAQAARSDAQDRVRCAGLRERQSRAAHCYRARARCRPTRHRCGAAAKLSRRREPDLSADLD